MEFLRLKHRNLSSRTLAGPEAMRDEVCIHRLGIILFIYTDTVYFFSLAHLMVKGLLPLVRMGIFRYMCITVIKFKLNSIYVLYQSCKIFYSNIKF